MFDRSRREHLKKELERFEQLFPAAETVLFKTRSRYHRILVVEKAGRRLLKFNNMTQTAVDADSGFFSFFSYINYLHLPLALKPDAERTLVIGLGGGALPRRMRRDYPEISIDVVEIDPAVVQVARDYFFLVEDDRLKVTVADGREFITSTRVTYDHIIIDAFNSDSVPVQLTTEGFFRQVKDRLSSDGVMAFNAISALRGMHSGTFDSVHRTVKKVWEKVYTFAIGYGSKKDPESLRNIIIMATDRVVPREVLEERIAGRVDGRVTVPGFSGFINDLCDADL